MVYKEIPQKKTHIMKTNFTKILKRILEENQTCNKIDYLNIKLQIIVGQYKKMNCFIQAMIIIKVNFKKRMVNNKSHYMNELIKI